MHRFTALLASARLLEGALAAAAGVDLRLDHVDRAWQLLGRRHGFLDGEGRLTLGYWYTILP